MSAPLLQTDELQVAYGPIRAVQGVSCELWPGELVAVIGSNGAGKTSFLRAISGLVPLAGGSVRLDGQDLAEVSADVRVRKGLAHVPEGRKLFGPLTVQENLRLGTFVSRRDHGKDEIEEMLGRIYDLFPVLAERRRQAAGTLSGGEQQMMAIGRALMSFPRVLLLDEPSLGLAPKMVSAIFEALVKLNESGLSVLCVEQNATLALEVSSRCYLFQLGRVAMAGESSSLRDDANLADLYLGGKVEEKPAPRS